MGNFFLHFSLVLTVIIFIPLYRVVKGPTIFDRMLGAGAIGTKTMVLILTIGFAYNRLDMFIDITLAYAVLNFIVIIAIAKFLGTEKSKE
ncbi:MAG: pH regulation protein F [Proteobacteria bacterium]|nr:pH regulation protein F [Pseudomonadota bacterium]MBU1743318.1 pH regulation protein F [Pseudomonadota bacterium]MBU1964856.1 pH regulation protein F [Pseudomonadota bacterium]MBU4371833.1 pH regulation protein F [Pseudomonadota bacterium]MBU4581427.1 pH regulation protein F [Pseudomonadota bacterium]